MTSEERKRAKAIEDAMCTMCSKINRSAVRLIATAVLIIIMDVALFIPMIKDDELYVVLTLHIIFLTMMSNLFLSVFDSFIGSKSLINDTGNQTFVGSMFLGKFICTMPYEARDVSGLRLINWEKHMILNTALTSALMVTLEIFGRFGYTEYDGITGVLVLTGLAVQIVSLPLISITKHFYFGMCLSMFLSMAPMFLIFGATDDTGETSVELASLFSEKLGAFGIVSGVPGVLILAVLTAVSIFAAEFIFGRTKKTSWNIRR